MSLARRIALGLLALLLAGGLATAPAGGRVHRYPARLLVYAQEWSLWPSRAALPAGAVGVELENRGQDAHDLRIQREGRGGALTGRAQGVAVTSSGALSTGAWHLARGRYLLYCSLPGHRDRGMRTVLVVR